MTFTKMDPAHVDEANDLYNRELSSVISQQKGHRFHYLLLSAVNSGEAVSITAWDSREDAEAYEQSGTYKELVGILV